MSFLTKKKSIFAIVLVLLSTAIIIFIVQSRSEKSAPNEFIEITKGDISIHVMSTGVIEPRNRLEVKPPIAGRIEEVLVKEGDLVKKGDTLAWMSSNERAALLDAAQAKGDAEVKHWETYYKATPIMSPIDGTVILRNVESGQTFTNQDAVFALSDILSVKANVDETDLGLVKKGQDVIISLDAYPSKDFKGIVEHIAYEAKTVSNVTTYEVHIIPINPPEFLRSGMTSNVTFIIESTTGILLVPTTAIIFDKGETSVMVKSKRDQKIVTRAIRVGISDGKNSEVVSGLELGERVLIQGIGASKEIGGNPFRANRRKKK